MGRKTSEEWFKKKPEHKTDCQKLTDEILDTYKKNRVPNCDQLQVGYLKTLNKTNLKRILKITKRAYMNNPYRALTLSENEIWEGAIDYIKSRGTQNKIERASMELINVQKRVAVNWSGFKIHLFSLYGRDRVPAHFAYYWLHSQERYRDIAQDVNDLFEVYNVEGSSIGDINFNVASMILKRNNGYGESDSSDNIEKEFSNTKSFRESLAESLDIKNVDEILNDYSDVDDLFEGDYE